MLTYSFTYTQMYHRLTCLQKIENKTLLASALCNLLHRLDERKGTRNIAQVDDMADFIELTRE